MNKECLITVAIPTYNHGRFISKAIESVLEQGIDDLELIILDNHSEDDTENIVKKYLADKRIKYIKNEENIGLNKNWAKANEMANGKYVATLHADDFYYEGHLKKLIKLLEDNPSCSLAYVPCKWVDVNNNTIKIFRHPGHPEFSIVNNRNELALLLIYDCYVTPSSAVIRKDIIRQIAPPDPDIIFAGDYDFWVRIAQINPSFIYEHEPSVAYRIIDSNGINFFSFNNVPLLNHIRIIEKVLADKKSFEKIKGFEHQIFRMINNKISSCPEEFINYDIKERLKNISDLIYNNNFKSSPKGFAQLFIDSGSGFSEAESIKINDPLDLDVLVFDLSMFKDIRAIRFDPLDNPIALKIKDVSVFFNNGLNLNYPLLPLNESIKINGVYYFFHNDPIFMLYASGNILNKANKISIKIDYNVM